MGTGGWRLGAGRPGWRRKLEHCLVLDVRRLARVGLLFPHRWTSWRWKWDSSGEESGSVGIRGGKEAITLEYQQKGDPVSFPIRLTYTPCNFGGSRPWFICPACWRRRAVLAYGGGGWYCRCCLKLAYTSEAEDAMGRLWRKQRKIEKRLGPDGERPKRMHWRTYERIWEQIEEIEGLKDEVLISSLLPYLDSLGKSTATDRPAEVI